MAATIITKARIEIAAGAESLTVGGRKITKHKPITTTDRAEIRFWQTMIPRVTVTALEKQKVASTPKQRAPEVAAPPTKSSPAPAPAPSPAPVIEVPRFLPWSASDPIDKLREAMRSRDIAVSDSDTKNSMIAQLSDFDADADDADDESDDENSED